MADSPTTTTAEPAAPKIKPPGAGGASGLGELGRTTSSRGWLALIALLLVIVSFTIWGLFGTIPVQSTIPATVTNGSIPIQITAGVTGTVATVTQPKSGQSGVLPAGFVLMTIQPEGGGAPATIKTPSQMGVALQVLQGSPVEAQTVVATGVPIAGTGSDGGKAGVYTFVSLDVVQSLQTAESLSVTPTAPDLASTPAPIKIVGVSAVPESQQQIANLTGNTIYAEDAYADAGGTPYAVLLEYENAADADKITGNAAAEITVTQSTPHPLSLLFGS